MKRNNHFSFQMECFSWNNRTYIFKKSVICNVEYKDKLWIYKVPYYGLHSFSEDKEEAFGDLNEEFAFLCGDLLNEKDENLTGGAIKLRDLIKNNLNV